MRKRNYYKHLIISAALLLSLALSRNLVTNRAPLSASDETSLPKKVMVTRVIDGDTIIANNSLRIRYTGIDAPETKNPYRPVGYYGKEASSYNRDLVLGKEVLLEYDVQKFDKYGRALAYVYVDGIFVNAELVKNGYARAFTVPPNVKYSGLFASLQKEARKTRTGLWSKEP